MSLLNEVKIYLKRKQENLNNDCNEWSSKNKDRITDTETN